MLYSSSSTLHYPSFSSFSLDLHSQRGHLKQPRQPISTPLSNDRASFIKSQTQLIIELDALGSTARGDVKGGYNHNFDLDDDNESWASDSPRNPANQPLPPSTANSGQHTASLLTPRLTPLYLSSQLAAIDPHQTSKTTHARHIKPTTKQVICH